MARVPVATIHVASAGCGEDLTDGFAQPVGPRTSRRFLLAPPTPRPTSCLAAGPSPTAGPVSHITQTGFVRVGDRFPRVFALGVLRGSVTHLSCLDGIVECRLDMCRQLTHVARLIY